MIHPVTPSVLLLVAVEDGAAVARFADPRGRILATMAVPVLEPPPPSPETVTRPGTPRALSLRA